MSREYAEGEYEAERARRISANRAKLREIGFKPLSQQQPKKPPPKPTPRRKRKAPPTAPTAPTRVSRRVENQGESVDLQGAELRGGAAQRLPRAASPR